MSGASAGLFGKLPARGDFVRVGLPGSFVTPWDGWLQEAVAGSKRIMGEDWLAAWLEAPVWRFTLGAGLCGEAAVLGVLLPSVDRVGRYFPLTIAAVLAPAGAPPAALAEAWLDDCEAAGRSALEQDATPDQVVRMLPPLPADGAQPAAGSVWWTVGGPRVPAGRRACAGLPEAATFAGMLDAAAVGQEER